jgi:hypothetical protein
LTNHTEVTAIVGSAGVQLHCLPTTATRSEGEHHQTQQRQTAFLPKSTLST